VTLEALGATGGQPSVEAVVEGQAPTEQVVELDLSAGPSGEMARLVTETGPPFQVVAVLAYAESQEIVASRGTTSLAPTDREVIEPDMSAAPSLGRARLVREQDPSAGPPFRVVSVPKTSEAGASSVALLPPSEPFLYLSLDEPSQGNNPFPGVTSQDPMSSPCLSDSALGISLEQGYQLTPSEAEAASGLESDGADSTLAELSPGQFQVVRRACRKRKKSEAMPGGWFSP
jgi:hypothetical protein